ncbi:MAG TPA: hypothetical protein VFL85_01165 [Candidatus Saccharimonadales bacterium]|nr:hypothetical protein [Candidatus Saccharimonadales bacterium]
MFSVFDDVELASLQGYGREALCEASGLTDAQLSTVTGFAADQLIAACEELGETSNDE